MTEDEKVETAFVIVLAGLYSAVTLMRSGTPAAPAQCFGIAKSFIDEAKGRYPAVFKA